MIAFVWYVVEKSGGRIADVSGHSPNTVALRLTSITISWLHDWNRLPDSPAHVVRTEQWLLVALLRGMTYTV